MRSIKEEVEYKRTLCKLILEHNPKDVVEKAYSKKEIEEAEKITQPTMSLKMKVM